MTTAAPTDFDTWLGERFRESGPFTVLIVLMSITAARVDPLRSTHLHVLGDETQWAELTRLFAGSGVAWDGAAFFPATDDPIDGLVIDDVAKQVLRDLTDRLHGDRLTLNSGWFFDRLGRQLQVEVAGDLH